MNFFFDISIIGVDIKINVIIETYPPKIESTSQTLTYDISTVSIGKLAFILKYISSSIVKVLGYLYFKSVF